MPYFTDDDVTSNRARMTKESPIHHDSAMLIAEDDYANLYNGFTALQSVLPDYPPREGTTQAVQCAEEAATTDCQDSVLTNVHYQMYILSSTLTYIRYLELRRQDLRQEKAALEARIISLKEAIKSLIIERVKVERTEGN